MTVDVGAEAMLNRRPEGVDLARELDLEIVHPTTAASRLWTRGELRPLPRSLMGVPLDLDGLAASGVLSDEGLDPGPRRADAAPDRARRRRLRRRPGGRPVRRRGRRPAGRAAARRCVRRPRTAAVGPRRDPAAGHPRRARRLAPRGRRRRCPTSDEPVFAGLPGGMGRLPTGPRRHRPVRRPHRRDRPRAAAHRTTGLRARRRRRPATPRPSPPTPSSWPPPPHPPHGSSRDLAPAAAAELAEIEYASMAVVTLAFRADDVGEHLPDSSGFLVPPVDGRRIKASTFSFAKWDWVREAGLDAVDGDDVVLLRTSLGRHREELALQVTDDELVAVLARRPRRRHRPPRPPVDSHVQRWGGGLPQYAVGHLDRVERIRADGRPGPRSRGLRRGVRRRRHPRRHRLGPAGGRPGRRGARPEPQTTTVALGRGPLGVRRRRAWRRTAPAARRRWCGRRRVSTGVTPPIVPVTNTSSAV